MSRDVGKGITTIQRVISQTSADLKVYMVCGKRLNEIVKYESYVILCGDLSGCDAVTIQPLSRPSNTTPDFYECKYKPIAVLEDK